MRFDTAVDVSDLMAEAARARVPVQLLDVASSESAGVYDHSLVLARPDQHVAWRSNLPPRNPSGLVDLISGRRD